MKRLLALVVMIAGLVDFVWRGCIRAASARSLQVP